MVRAVPEPTWNERIKPFVDEVSRKLKLKTDCDQKQGTLDGENCVVPPPPPPPAPAAIVEAPAASQAVASSIDGLIGSLGYALPGGNCVNEPGVNNPYDGTNPISWAVLYGTPHIGSTALFPYNHVGVVSGLWSNGDVEIRHQNCPGCATRYPAGSFRGFR